jgi:hypothetical protein
MMRVQDTKHYASNRLLKNVMRKAGCKAHGAQHPRHITQTGEGVSTAQRRRRPPQQFFSSLSQLDPHVIGHRMDILVSPA